MVDTRQFKNLPKKRKKTLKKRWFLIAAALLLSGYYLWALQSKKTVEIPVAQNQEQETPPQISTDLKTFSGEEFKSLARSIRYPNTQQFEEPPEITGNKQADDRIRKVAESRGFIQTSLPVTSIVKIDEPRLDLLGDDLLQPLAALAWKDLKAAAEEERIPLSLLSAYRSPEYQRGLFLSRLKANLDDIINGKADKAIEQVLLMTAPPGFSRHHTGYTIDLWCEDASGTFVNSSCFRWLKANNYKAAKQTGWIPSYPEGVRLQGPEPEPWEYVWAGNELLQEK